jgi:glycosyltransferase involved in cell wall biosynthesis
MPEQPIEPRALVKFSRVLVIAQSAPWPARGGGDLRTANTLSALASAGVETGLATFAPLRASDATPAGIGTWAPSDGEPLAEDPGRALHWIREEGGHPSDLWWTPASRSAIERALDALDPQLVVLEHLWTHRALDIAARARRRTILSSQNVEGPLHAALARATDGRAPAALAALMARRTGEIEAALVGRVDQVWACSSVDAEGFERHYSVCAPVEVIPNTIAVEARRAGRAPPASPLVLFVGSFGYPPNVDAALWLGSTLLPALHEAGTGARLRLIGADAPEVVRGLSADPAIEVTGFVKDLRPHLEEATVTAVPLFTGGGTRFKVLEAFGAGVPVVSTAKGVEGIDAVPGEHYLAAETVEGFTAAIADLCANSGLRERLTRSARTLVEERYSTIGMQRQVLAALERLADAGGGRS